MLPARTRVIAAVSGGPDSVCLLHLLRELAPSAGFHLAGVAHVNHMLRGDASEEEEKFVAGLAGGMGLPFYCSQEDPRKAGGNLEQEARRARQRFFASLLGTTGPGKGGPGSATGEEAGRVRWRGGEGKADRVALGHTLDDQAETVLFRLLRGAGIAGLAGILPATAEGLIRPLLGVRRAEVEQYLRDRGIEWRQDSSNREPRFARNRIRHELLPQLERDWNPHLTELLAQLADQACEEQRWWSGEVRRHSEEVIRASGGGVELHTGQLSVLSRAMARRVVRRAVELAKGSLAGISFPHVEAVIELAGQGPGRGRLALPGLEATRSFEWIRLAPPAPSPGTGSQASARPAPTPAIPLKAPGLYPSPGGNSLIRLEVVDQPRSGGACATLGVDLYWPKLPQGLQLRCWEPGDRYRPVGHRRERKIQDLFQRARVPSWRRGSWPIISGGGKIVWAREFGAAAEFAGTGDGGPLLRIQEIPRRG